MRLRASRSRAAWLAAAWLGVLAFSSGAVCQEVAFEVVHVFDKSSRSTEGAGPGKLSLGPDGALYGTAGEGGPSGVGTVFRMTLGGAITTLHAFSGRDGMNPDSCLLLGADGAFYGTTSLTRVWGVSRSTVFRITPQGQYSEVYVYPWNDEIPTAVVVKGSDGQAYEVSFGQNVSFQLIGDKRFAEALPAVSVVNRERSGELLPIKALFSEMPSEPVSMADPPPVTFSGRAKRPLCGVRVADLYGRVWGLGGGPLGVGAMALGPVGKGPENGLVAWFFPPGQAPQKNPDFAKVFNIHGQYVPSVDGGVYVLAGDEIVQINREGRAPAVASIAALLDGGTGRGQLVDGLLTAADGYMYGQVVTRSSAAVQIFRFRPDRPLEVLKMPPTGVPLVHFMDLTELADGSFIGPADGANGPGTVIVRLMVR